MLIIFFLKPSYASSYLPTCFISISTYSDVIHDTWQLYYSKCVNLLTSFLNLGGLCPVILSVKANQNAIFFQKFSIHIAGNCVWLQPKFKGLGLKRKENNWTEGITYLRSAIPIFEQTTKRLLGSSEDFTILAMVCTREGGTMLAYVVETLTNTFQIHNGAIEA